MSKAKFAAARELITEKKYDQARSILETIDHPTAKDWLKKLDEIAPINPNFSQKVRLQTLRTSTTQVKDTKPSRRSLPKIGVVAGAITLIIATAVLFLISEFNQSTAQIEALVTYCMKITDSSRDKCTTVAQYLVSDKELFPIFADCIANFAPDSESFIECTKNADEIIYDRVVAEDTQRVALYWLCSGSHITTDSSDTESDYLHTVLNDQRFGEAVRDEDCRNWMVELEELYPTAQVINDCVGTRSEYFELFDWRMAAGHYLLVSFNSHWETANWEGNIRVNFINVVNCMMTNLGDKFPALPTCTADYPRRIACTIPSYKPT